MAGVGEQAYTQRREGGAYSESGQAESRGKGCREHHGAEQLLTGGIKRACPDYIAEGLVAGISASAESAGGQNG